MMSADTLLIPHVLQNVCITYITLILNVPESTHKKSRRIYLVIRGGKPIDVRIGDI